MTSHSDVPRAPTGRSLDWSASTDVGRRRKNNEDAWGAWSLSPALSSLAAGPTALPSAGVVLAVSDGMGGAAGGEVASRFCIDQLGARLGRVAEGAGERAAALRQAFLDTHEALAAKAAATPGLAGMGATLSALWLTPDGQGVVVHVGDSRIYHAPEGGVWKQLTEDHNVGAAMVRRGEMTAEAVRRLRYRSMLEQVMGGDGTPIDPQVLTFSWAPGGRFALCSDGLHGPLEDALPARLDPAFAGSVEQGAHSLVDAANAAGGPDNVTVILARFMPLPGS